jgi:hypothetical protein
MVEGTLGRARGGLREGGIEEEGEGAVIACAEVRMDLIKPTASVVLRGRRTVCPAPGAVAAPGDDAMSSVRTSSAIVRRSRAR